MSLADKIRSAQIRAGEDAVTDHLRELGLITEEKPEQQAKTISMRHVRYADGSFGVDVSVTGLESEKHAELAMQNMQRLFCGEAISEH